MGSGTCSIRAIWILNNQDAVVFSRRFSVVETRWRAACNEFNSSHDFIFPTLPSDSELAVAFVDRKKRAGSPKGYGIRVPLSIKGSDSWVDDPITRYVISLHMNRGKIIKDGNDDDRKEHQPILWPLTLHVRGYYCVLVLPLVEPRQVKEYSELCELPGCGQSMGDKGISRLLFDLPAITGAFMVANAIGDIISGDNVEPEVIVNASPSVGGLLDSLTGSIGIAGISSRPKPSSSLAAASVPITSSSPATSDIFVSKPLDKELLRNFIVSAMPFGIPLDLNPTNIFSVKANGFTTSDMPPGDHKQPAWKPYLYKGKQRILFTVNETVHAALYDRDDIPDSVFVSGQINCRAELEGLPDVSVQLRGMSKAQVESPSFHPCAQSQEQSADKQSIVFSPPLGNFVLVRYVASCSVGLPVQGFYQLSMVSEDEGAFIFKLSLMERCKPPLSMEFCNVVMPFPRRKIVSFDGTPSIGAVTTTEHSVEWKIIANSRSISGKTVEATFPGTIKFAPLQSTKPFPESQHSGPDADFDDGISNTLNVEEFLMEKMNKALPPVDLDEPISWHAYSYAKVSFKITGGSLSSMSIDPKSVSFYPTTKAPVESSHQVSSGDYILWNTLGKSPSSVP